MKKYTISLGLTTADGNQQFNFDIAIKKVAEFLAKNGIQGATFKQATGLWEGSLENTLLIEIYSDDLNQNTMVCVCKNLRDLFMQNCVLLNVEEAPTTLFI